MKTIDELESLLEEEISPCNFQNTMTYVERTLSDIDESDCTEEEKETMRDIVRDKLREEI